MHISEPDQFVQFVLSTHAFTGDKNFHFNHFNSKITAPPYY
eukprot:UN13499